MRRSDDALQGFKAIAPVLLSLIIVAVGRRGIEERYQIVADILVGVLAVVLLLTVLHIAYPLAIEQPADAVSRRLRLWRQRRVERKRFSEWAAKWREYSSLIVRTLNRGQQSRPDSQYQELRGWLMEHHAYLPSDIIPHVKYHLKRQWGRFNLTEYELALRPEDGFFPLYRHLDLGQQIAELGREEHRMTHTLAGIWDALSSYSATRGWGALEPLTVRHRTTRRHQDGLPRV